MILIPALFLTALLACFQKGEAMDESSQWAEEGQERQLSCESTCPTQCSRHDWFIDLVQLLEKGQPREAVQRALGRVKRKDEGQKAGGGGGR
ncbi:unnamed protein product [Cylicocyclus nassatus]|uniref:Uncharacterized protein n=1 Tax=Cylicocyclus nassatus TaxID=53992 RepID=A0AA36M7H1_CYLNA|nr:unnamed protein product [Cylicocyclus nassatus]